MAVSTCEAGGKDGATRMLRLRGSLPSGNVAPAGVSFTPAASVLRGIQMEAVADQATFAGGIKVSTVQGLLEIAPALDKLQGIFGEEPGAPGAPQGAQPEDPEQGSTRPTPAPTQGRAPAAPGSTTAASEGPSGRRRSR